MIPRVGPNIGGDGASAPLRADVTGALVTTDGHGRYGEIARRGNLFILDSDSVTLAAANATKSALGTAKFILGFFNPPNSLFNCEILRALIATVSGTPGGPFFYNYFPFAGTLTSASTGTVQPGLLSSVAASIVRPLVNVALVTSPAQTDALKQLRVMGGPAAIAAGAGLYAASDEPAGSIVVPPGTLFGLMCLAVGTTHIVQASLEWEEVPVK